MIRKSKTLQYLLLSLSLIGSDAYTLPYTSTSFTYGQIYQDKNGIIFNSANLPIIVGGGMLGATIIGIGVGYVAHRLRSKSKDGIGVDGLNGLDATEPVQTTTLEQNQSTQNIQAEMIVRSTLSDTLENVTTSSSNPTAQSIDIPSTSNDSTTVEPVDGLLEQIKFKLSLYMNNTLAITIHAKNGKTINWERYVIEFNQKDSIVGMLIQHFKNFSKEEMDEFVSSKIYQLIDKRTELNNNYSYNNYKSKTISAVSAYNVILNKSHNQKYSSKINTD